MITIFLLIIFIILQIVDSITTYKAISKGNVELNPFMKYLFDKLGIVYSLIITKTAVSIFIGIVSYFKYVYSDYVLVFVCIFYVFVVLNNIKFLKI